MSTIRTKLRKSTRDGFPGSVVYLISHNRKVRVYTTHYKLLPEEWDVRKSMVIVPTTSRAELCRSISQRIKWDLERLHQIIHDYELIGQDFKAEDIIKTFASQREKQWFFRFMDSVIARMRQLGRTGTAKNYQAALNCLASFRNHNDLTMQEITPSLIEEYQAWLAYRGIKPNSISFYMRILRATYQRAVEQDLVKDARPFRQAYTKIEKTAKRAISLEDIKRIKNLDLSHDLQLEKARDIFLFLFYTRGMSFIDAAYLKKSDLKGDEIHYRRHKTNQLITVGVNEHILQILRIYKSEKSPYLLPIITSIGDNHRLQYENALRRTNNALKRIAEMAKVTANLTTYTVRHSWATIAKQKGVATATISDALGHDSEKTTQIYLASISSSEINKANDLILRDL